MHDKRGGGGRNRLKRAGEEALVRAAELFDLPADVIAGVARVEVTGGREVVIENHGGILEYSGGLVRVAGGTAVIEVSGDSLVLEAMSASELRLRGRVFGVEFRY